MTYFLIVFKQFLTSSVKPVRAIHIDIDNDNDNDSDSEP